MKAIKKICTVPIYIKKANVQTKMELKNYEVHTANFKQAFRERMGAAVESIEFIHALNRVAPSGPLPVGFVLTNDGRFYLVGWATSKKRVHWKNLKPWRKDQVLLYSTFRPRRWARFKLYQTVFTRLHYLQDYPTIVSSVENFEDSRQALYTCAQLLNCTERLAWHEVQLLRALMKDNPELLENTCENLDLKPSLETLEDHVRKQYSATMEVSAVKDYEESGLLRFVQEHIASKWNEKKENIKEK